jgi:hypothetical protein
MQSNAKTALIKKAKRKFISNGIKNKLCEIADTPLLTSYQSSFLCSHILTQKGTKLTSLYCNQRWCPTCTAIKTAKFIDAYRHELEIHKDYYFVTLTVKSDEITADNLKSKMDQMLKTWAKINGNARILKHREQMNIWHGMRKTECTYRDNGTFHPHFHILVRGENVAKWVVSEWLRHNPTSNSDAQDVREATQGIEKELFKYYTKLISGSTKRKRKHIDAIALNAVLVAMIGKRVFHPFGTFKRLIKEEELPELVSQEFEIEEKNNFWHWHRNDWIDHDTGEVLSGFVPSESLQKIVLSEGEKSAPPEGGGGGEVLSCKTPFLVSLDK